MAGQGVLWQLVSGFDPLGAYNRGQQQAQQRDMQERSLLQQIANQQWQQNKDVRDYNYRVENDAADRNLKRDIFANTQNVQNAKLGIDREELNLKKNIFGAKQQQTAAEALRPDIEGEGKLRKEYSGHNKTYLDVRRAYDRILASKDDAVGDISTIFGYMRMLDPSSTVREGEFLTAQNAAGVPDQVRNIYNRLLSGERLNPQQRSLFRGQAEALYQKIKGEHDAIRTNYSNLAKQYGFNPERVLLDYGPEPQNAPIPTTRAQNDPMNPNPAATTPPPAANAPKVRLQSKEQWDAAPSGTLFTDGKKTWQKP